MHSRASVVAIALAFSPLAASSATTRNEILFYAPLDGTATAAIAAGDPAPQPGLNPRFVEGRHGRALRTGRLSWAKPELFPAPTTTFTMDIDIHKAYGAAATMGPLRYAAEGNIRAEQGTLSFWMRPVNWQSGGRERFLANLGMKDTLALFYPSSTVRGPAGIRNCCFSREFRGSGSSEAQNLVPRFSWRD